MSYFINLFYVLLKYFLKDVMAKVLDNKLEVNEFQLVITFIFAQIPWLLVGWVLWHINLYRLFNAKSIFMQIVSSILKKFSLI